MVLPARGQCLHQIDTKSGSITPHRIKSRRITVLKCNEQKLKTASLEMPSFSRENTAGCHCVHFSSMSAGDRVASRWKFIQGAPAHLAAVWLGSAWLTAPSAVSQPPRFLLRRSRPILSDRPSRRKVRKQRTAAYFRGFPLTTVFLYLIIRQRCSAFS